MKKLILILTLITLIGAEAQQNYLINFTNSGGNLNSIKVENLSSGEMQLLNGTDTLKLILSTGVENYFTETDIFELFPNPSKGLTILNFFAKKSGSCKITITDIAGKKLFANKENLEIGYHKFEISNLVSGVYFISVNGDNYNYTKKLISNNISSADLNIKYVGKQDFGLIDYNSKSANSTITMNYTTAQFLKFTGYNGSCNEIIYDIPINSKTINFNILQPTAPISVSATETTICNGQSSILSYLGGFGTTFKWYNNICGGSVVGTGNNLYVLPSQTTTYYGRWENECGNSSCATITINVSNPPIVPISVNATDTILCNGESTILSYDGGLGTTFKWYKVDCGISLVGIGNNITIAPTTTTAYYGRWENICGFSDCKNIMINVNNIPTSPTTSNHLIDTNQISWRWNKVATAIGYKWNTSNDYQTAIDMGIDTIKIETGITPNTNYTRYIWAYNDCGNSGNTILNATTNDTLLIGCGEVINSTTGKTWHACNLGATRVATSSTDHLAYGSLYQWGRGRDGHEIITWTASNAGFSLYGTTSILSSTGTPNHNLFITSSSIYNYDWRTAQINNLWQGVNGANNPCPTGFRLPTNNELDSERLSWSTNNSVGAYNSVLKMPMAGYRSNYGVISSHGSNGYYYSSSIINNQSRALCIYNNNALTDYSYYSNGLSVRCIKD